MTLPGAQQELFDRIYAANSNVAVVHSQNVAGPYNWAAAFFADGRISKDSSVFTDTDGRSYFVRDTAHDCDSMSLLSPSGLNTSGICSETGNASQTHNCSGYARAPEGPNGATYLCEGVAMFRDPQDGRLFLLGSHLTGWGANAAMLSVSDSATVCGSHWTYLGNPSRGTNAASTYASGTSTATLPGPMDLRGEARMRASSSAGRDHASSKSSAPFLVPLCGLKEPK